MRTFPPAVQLSMEAGRESVRGLIRIDLGSGAYRFVKDSVELFDGVDTWLPGGVIEVSDIPGATGMAAARFTVRLSAVENSPLTPDVLKTIEAEDYSDRPVTIYDAHLDPDTGALLYVEALRRGYIDTIDHEEGDAPYALVATCETRALDYSRTNGRLRTSADQQRRLPAGVTADRFLEHAATRARQKVYWGQATATPPATSTSPIVSRKQPGEIQ